MESNLKKVLWLSFRLLKSKENSFFDFSGWMTLLGVALGVACLVVAMAVVSGFESTLQKSISDVSGHLQIYRSFSTTQAAEDFTVDLKKKSPEIVSASPFVFVEAILAHQGKTTGVILQGVRPEAVSQVLELKSRLREGLVDLSDKDGVAQVLIGQGMSQRFNLKPGDTFRVVSPVATERDPAQFKRKLGRFKVAGVLDLGRHEFNERAIVASLSAAQALADLGERSFGLIVKTSSLEAARKLSPWLQAEYAGTARVRDWYMMNETLFRAVQIEKPVIFFIILVILIAAAFNVCIQLYVFVVRKYPTLSLLKALGLTKNQVLALVSLQGFFVGVVGLALGCVLGVLLSFCFTLVESHLSLIPGSVYKIDRIDLDLRFMDVVWVIVSTLLICTASAFAPAWRGARMSLVEGLKNE